MMHTGSDPRLDTLQRRRALLSHTSLLRDCPAAELDTLARHAQLKARPAGALLLSQDTPGDVVYFIAYGRVRLALLGDGGRELTLAELERGDCFGETAVLAGGRHAASALAEEEVLLLAIGRDAFVAHVQAHPATAVRLAGELARRLSASQQQLADVAMHPVDSRVLRALERLAAHDGEATHGGVVLRRRLTHQELASMIGTCRETVTRSLAALGKRGLIVSRNGHLVLAPRI